MFQRIVLSVLAWHIDQKDNELSLSLQIEVTPPEQAWPLYFVDYNTTVRPGQRPPKTISLDPWHVSTAAQLVARDNQVAASVAAGGAS